MVYRVRIRFRKQGDLRLTSHRDLMRTVERLFCRAGVAVCETEGFHPKPRFHYPTSLALGFAGLDEVLEADLREPIDPDAFVALLNAHGVPGLEFFAAQSLAPQSKKGQASHLEFEILLPEERLAQVADRVSEFCALASCPVDRDGKPVDLRPLVEGLSLSGNLLSMRLRVVQEAGARPRDVLEWLGLSADEILLLDATRTRVEMSA